jgi:Uma2 family endonuclease
MVDISQVKMTAAEFLELPETNKLVQLINGEVIVAPSPVDKHQEASSNLHYSLRQQVPSGMWRYAPADVYLDEDNVVQPDLFWIRSDNQTCRLIDGKYWHGAPDLVIEILSPGTTRQDRDTKYRLYEKHGVREYWIVEAEEQFIEVYVLREGKYERHGVFGLGEEFGSPVLGNVTLKVDMLLKN